MHRLDSPLEEVYRLAPAQKAALRALGLRTVRDLLFHFPTHYGNVAQLKYIENILPDEYVTLYVKVKKIKTGKAFRSHMPLSKATLTDDTGTIEATWFHQPYIAKLIKEDMLVRVQGKVTHHKDKFNLVNPEIEPVREVPTAVGNSLFSGEHDGEIFEPQYPATRGITSRWFHHAVQRVLVPEILNELQEPIPEDILTHYSLPTLATALVWIHLPKNKNDALAARKRFAFEEVFLIQLANQKERQEYKDNPAFIIKKDQEALAPFVNRFPFKATGAQQKAIADILKDFASGHAMSRLLEGDVGSGKTAVAATTAYAAITTKPQGQSFGTLQVAYMAPTEILAAQHFASFITYFSHMPISIGLITGSGCKKFPSKVDPSGATNISRTQLLKWVANGEIAILIGTHALIQKSVKFENLAYIIIDEQHRFGTKQRKQLRRKDDIIPHLLSMTATPIPRTLALTIYGNLDLTLLDELPAGRKQIITHIVRPVERAATYDAIRRELQAGRQAYVICPRINEPDPDKEMAVNAKSVKEEAKRLKKSIFPEYNIDILHSKMSSADKEETMRQFEKQEIDILVATSVVEVGVNVPNATVIIIEGAERFGLAQLHQLRGRVQRSSHQAYCYVFSESEGEKTVKRLSALVKAKNGFELAEYDLEQRGAGELSGRTQWGVSDLAMEAIKNLKMVEAARTEAQRIVSEDPHLAAHPHLQARIAAKEPTHFE